MTLLSEITDSEPAAETHSGSPVARVTRIHRETPVELSPVRAEKDPRVATLDDAGETALSALAGVADSLVALVRGLLPHAWLDDAAYRLVVAKLDREPATAEILRSGCASIEANMGRPAAELSTSELQHVLRSIEGGLFFRTLLGRSIRHLYDDPRVWAGCGYEGVHGCREGAPRDNIADADWLPDPVQA